MFLVGYLQTPEPVLINILINMESINTDSDLSVWDHEYWVTDFH